MLTVFTIWYTLSISDMKLSAMCSRVLYCLPCVLVCYILVCYILVCYILVCYILNTMASFLPSDANYPVV